MNERNEAPVTPTAGRSGARSSGQQPPSERVRVRRKPDRGHYDRATIEAIVDAAIIGHVGYLVDGQPFVTPTNIWRDGDRVYWHSSVGGQMVQALRKNGAVCLTVSHLDALVLARTATNHSVDYRSVLILGQAHLVSDEGESRAALRGLIEQLYPGRWDQLRPMTTKEVAATTVLWVDLAEASAKVRDLGAHDDPADGSWPAWAGTIPISTVIGTPIPDEHVPAGMAPPVMSKVIRGG